MRECCLKEKHSCFHIGAVEPPHLGLDAQRDSARYCCPADIVGSDLRSCLGVDAASSATRAEQEGEVTERMSRPPASKLGEAISRQRNCGRAAPVIALKGPKICSEFLEIGNLLFDVAQRIDLEGDPYVRNTQSLSQAVPGFALNSDAQ